MNRIDPTSNSQVDRLGDTFRGGDVSDEDLRALDRHRRSYEGAYSSVLKTLRTATSLEVTGRPAKSTTAIVEKLRRESVRLSQIQDIAGLRLVVQGPVEQNDLVVIVARAFPSATVVDRRLRPSNGYRAGPRSGQS